MVRAASTAKQNATAISSSATTIASNPDGVALMLDVRNITCDPRTLQQSRENIFAVEWKKFVLCCGLKYLAEEEPTDRARKLFRSVFEATYNNESEFDDALFIALGDSVDGDKNLVVIGEEDNSELKEDEQDEDEQDEDEQDKREQGKGKKGKGKKGKKGKGNKGKFNIGKGNKCKGNNGNKGKGNITSGNKGRRKGYVLKGRHIGFFRKVERTIIGFNKNYGASKESIPDHSCVVYRQGNNSELNYKVQDVTAAVELKLGESNCRQFVIANGFLAADPNLDKGHSPVGQALTYSLDVLHCLARCGRKVEEVPVVVVGGKKKNYKHDKLLCAVEAKLEVPKTCAGTFFYYINDIVPFTDDNFGEITAAIYLRTMTVGMEHASTIENLYRESPDGDIIFPGSLCCHDVSLGGTVLPTARLVASPILGATQITKGLTVNQGELFSFTGELVLNKENSNRIHSEQKITGHLLLKVHCLSVHNHLVKPLLTKKAIEKICSSDNEDLRKELSKVLLAYVEESPSIFISVMMDLTKIDEPKFTILRPIELNDKIYNLWTAFHSLVSKVLLPLANIGVVHSDLRAGWKTTHNILVRRIGDGFELLLVDYESLIMYDAQAPSDGRVINKAYLKLINATVTSHQYLWWQILLFAYVWQCQQINEDPKVLFAFDFVTTIFSNSPYENFRVFLGDQLENLQKLSQKTCTESEVAALLEILTKAFSNL